MKFIKKALCLILVLVLALSLAMSAYAAGSTIDQGQAASLDIYKYDLTRAEQDGVWDAASHVSTGTYDGSVISTLGGDAGQGTSYAIQGVKYSYLKLGSIDTYSQNGEAGAYNTTVLYGLPEGNAAQQFLSAIGLSYANAHHSAAGDGVNIHYFNSDTLISALASAINGNSILLGMVNTSARTSPSEDRMKQSCLSLATSIPTQTISEPPDDRFDAVSTEHLAL